MSGRGRDGGFERGVELLWTLNSYEGQVKSERDRRGSGELEN